MIEYVPDAYKRRAYLSEFHGSAGTAVVTADEALLWTDSRYWNEASIQLDATLWTLQKSGLPETLTISKWLASIATEHYQQHKKPIRIGMDPFVHPASFAKEVDDAMSDSVKNENFEESPGSLIIEAENLVDIIWDSDGIRPPLPTSPFRVHPAEYAGKTVIEKVELIRTAMSKKKATAVVLCTLDDVAYVLNVRAKGDIDTCPVGIAYCVITEQTIDLYCDAIKVQNIQDHLIESGIRVRPYDQIVSDVEQHCLLDSSNKVWIDKARSNYALVRVISPKQCVDSQNPVTPMKAVKNNSELAGMREAHIVDGVAMAKFMSWLENEINTKQRSVSEVEIDDVLTKYRSEQDGFLECSFPTIAGVGSNGAIIHYRAKADSQLMKYLNKDAPILIDSGGQYVYGTTDVTRTWSFQETPDPTFIDYYTRVLKGNIALDSMKFPENTPGLALDILARKFLWEISMDYGHGTGHGVGAALNVHEGPHSISPRWSNTEVLKAGMIVSNEPGYYEDGNFGLRIENLLEILYVNPEHNDSPDNGENDDNKGETKQPKGNQKKFLKFAKLTMIPIQKNLINVQLMTEEELDWLDSYHAEVWENVGSRLQDGSPEKIWLQEACSKIDRFV
jgi:Xaa-Pro aminopeptidase